MKILKKYKIRDFLDWIDVKYNVVIPTTTNRNDVIWGKYDKKTELILDTLPNMSIKSFLIPQMEPMLNFQDHDIQLIYPEDKNTVIFGIRSCDVNAIKFLDKFMSMDNIEDPIYFARRKNIYIISIACNYPLHNSCFCVELKRFPYIDDGFDLQFFDYDGGYIVISGSEVGDSLLQFNGFKELDINLDEIKTEMRSNFVEDKKIKYLIEDFSTNPPNDDFWKNISRYCIACGSCVYVCPTCTCLNTHDIPEEMGFIRFRHWDSCLFEGFTKEASGHNPREKLYLRLKRRYEHKFYYNLRREGEIGCVGCGRCSIVCGSGLGAIDLLKRIENSE